MSGIVARPALRRTGCWLPKWNLFAVPGLRHVHDRGARRDQPPAVRPARGRDRAGRRLSHRVLGIKFAMFYLAEYLHMITVSAVGRDAVPRRLARAVLPDFLPWLVAARCGSSSSSSWSSTAVWIRATLPRFRYDRLMSFGWKVLIPFGLLWILVLAPSSCFPRLQPRVAARSSSARSWPLADPGRGTALRRPAARRRPEGPTSERVDRKEPDAAPRDARLSIGRVGAWPGLLVTFQPDLPKGRDHRVPEGDPAAPTARRTSAATC